MNSNSNADNPLAAVLIVTEIFKSIQGESTWAGLPCAFVRLTGCPLRCSYCDTTYAYDGGTEMTIAAIMNACAAFDVPLVEVTGGEPLAQENCPLLVARLLEDGYTVLVETNGSMPIDVLPPDAIRIMDIKCPGSGMAECNDWSNIERLTERDEVKFVVSDYADYAWSRDVIGKYGLAARCRQVLISPIAARHNSGGSSPTLAREVAEWIVRDGLQARFQLQLHKQIWSPDQRGV